MLPQLKPFHPQPLCLPTQAPAPAKSVPTSLVMIMVPSPCWSFTMQPTGCKHSQNTHICQETCACHHQAHSRTSTLPHVHTPTCAHTHTPYPCICSQTHTHSHTRRAHSISSLWGGPAALEGSGPLVNPQYLSQSREGTKGLRENTSREFAS